MEVSQKPKTRTTTRPSSPIPGYACVLSRSAVPDSVQRCRLQPARLLCPRGFSKQQYCSGLSRPPPGDLPNPGIKPRSPALQVHSLAAKLPVKPMPRYISKENENSNSKRYMHPQICCSIISIAKTWEQPKYLSIDKDKDG